MNASRSTISGPSTQALAVLKELATKVDRVQCDPRDLVDIIEELERHRTANLLRAAERPEEAEYEMGLADRVEAVLKERADV